MQRSLYSQLTNYRMICWTLTLEGSMMTVGTKLRKIWLQSVRTLVLLKATSNSSMASNRRRSPSF